MGEGRKEGGIREGKKEVGGQGRKDRELKRKEEGGRGGGERGVDEPWGALTGGETEPLSAGEGVDAGGGEGEVEGGGGGGGEARRMLGRGLLG